MQRQSITLINHRALNDCRQMVSGSISLRSLRFFSPFLTVFVRYRCSSSIQGWRVVSPASARVSRALTYSGSCYLEIIFHIRDYHPLWLSFPECSIRLFQWMLQSSTPNASIRFALFPVRSPLLRESHLISFPLVTEMFHFTRFAPFKVMCITTHWVAPFGNLWIKAS